MESNKKYTLVLFLISTVFVLLIAAFNIIIDPTAIFESPKIVGLNHVKTNRFTSARLINAFNIYNSKPDTVIIGTSRAGTGLRCDHPALAKYKCENIALPATDMYEAYRYLQHTNTISKLERVVIGLDLMSFNQYLDNRIYFSEDWLSVSYDGSRQFPVYYAELLKIAVSSDTYRYSRKTLKASRKLAGEANENITSPEQPQPYDLWTATTQAYFQTIWFPGDSIKFSLEAVGNSESKLFMFGKILEYAYQNDIQLYIYISPVHAWLMEAMDARGLWDIFEQWKLGVVSLSEAIAVKNGRDPVTIWDFSGYNNITTSRYPHRSDKQFPEYYKDPAHFTPVIGNIILSRILTGKNTASFDFGQVINSNNISQHLERTRKDKSDYRRNHPDLYDFLTDLVNQSEKYRKSRKADQSG